MIYIYYATLWKQIKLAQGNSMKVKHRVWTEAAVFIKKNITLGQKAVYVDECSVQTWVICLYPVECQTILFDP